MRFSSTPRGARLARRLVAHRLDAWGFPYGGDVSEALTLVAAELVSNAVRHGHVAGRDFAVRLIALEGVVRVEVSDARGERVPLLSHREPPGDVESGRGLLLVAALADRWGAMPRVNGPGKTVWAEKDTGC
ncbi:ATP-binding protein [Streptomyces sp. NPDC015220]|uniref:ATP-binding protein n=1 Tax=Streptomyces sp. NPDC015220 TaxID=3364947 RepID=UPI0036F80A77